MCLVHFVVSLSHVYVSITKAELAMGALSKIAAATPTGGGNNIRDGLYLYYVERVTHHKGFKGERYVFEFRVVESEASTELDENGKVTPPNAVGTACSMVCLLDKHENAPGNAKAAILAITAPLGYTENMITEDFLIECAGAGNPLRGVAVRNETRRAINQGRSNPLNAGKPLTLPNWKAVSQTAEDIAKQRAWLDANGARADMSAPKGAEAPAPVTAPQGAAASLMARLGKPVTA